MRWGKTSSIFMKNLKAAVAVFLSVTVAVESGAALPYSSPANTNHHIKLPGRLGFVSESYSPAPQTSSRPDIILIQDLHVNRSVQLAISKIIKKLKLQGFVSGPIAVEGETGPVDLRSMQTYSNTHIRKQ